MNTTYLNIVYEDELSEVMIKKLIRESRKDLIVKTSISGRGNNYIKNNIARYNLAAKTIPFFVLTDLDRNLCPPELITKWLPYPKHPNLLFRIAVKEVENWLLADKDSLTKFLGVSKDLIKGNDIDMLPDSKEFIIKLARKSRKKSILNGICPKVGSTAKIGPDYNGILSRFIFENWRLDVAVNFSKSLNKAYTALRNFNPVL